MIVWLAIAAAGAGIPLVAWIVYPRIMLRRAAKSEPVMGGPAPDRLSVVVATREPPEAVRARLEDLLRGDWPPDQLELIVAVDGDPGPYRFPDLVPAPGRLVVVSRAGDRGKAVALNEGVAVATADVVVFTDTAQRFAPDTLGRLARGVAGGPYTAVSGALQIGNETDPGAPISRYWRLEKRLRQAEAVVHSTIGVTGAVYAMRRAHWTPLPAGLILDDLWIPMRLVLDGHRVGFDAEASATDLRRTTADQEYRRKVRTLTGNVQLIAWLPAVVLPWRNPVWFQFVCHKLLRLLTPWALAAFVAGMAGAAFSVSATVGWRVVAGGAAAAAVLLALPGSGGARLRRAAGWGAAMLAAIVVASWNGLRGRWNVWS